MIDFNSLTNDQKIAVVKSNDFKLKLTASFDELISVSKVPITGVVFEDRFNKALLLCGFTTGFIIGNHSVESDIAGFSLKGNKIYNRKKRLTNITSYRTTAQETIHDKIEYIKLQESKNCGYIICLREEKEKTFDYSVYFFEHGVDIFDLDNYVFKDKYSRNGEVKVGYVGYSEMFDTYMTIMFQTSHQLIINNLDVDSFDRNSKIIKILEMKNIPNAD